MTPVDSMRVDEANDTEITLGTGKMLAIFFGLVILCAEFFGMGFSMGRNSVRSAPELLPSPSASGGTRPSASNKSTTPPAESKPAEGSQQQTPTGTTASSNPAPQSSAPDQSAAQPPNQPGTGYFVQVAAVSKQEDAEALVEAL